MEGQPFLAQPDQGGLRLYEGELFGTPQDTGKTCNPEQVTWLPPVEPRQFLGLWNNFHERMALEGTRRPEFPLYFVKLPGCLSAHEAAISRPEDFVGKVKFEAELGIVIGKECLRPTLQAVDDCIFGYTCVNDVTAPQPLFEDDAFGQWCRAKSFPSFGPIGPWIATGVDPAKLRVQALLDGELKQDYPVGDMIFSPREIVQRVAREVRLYPGDVIACGTSVGASAMEEGQTIEIFIDGIGRLRNRFVG